jgi:hypothetical protein
VTFQALAKVQLTSFLFWDVTWHMLIAGYWRFRTTYCSHILGPSSPRWNPRRTSDNSTLRVWTPLLYNLAIFQYQLKTSTSWCVHMMHRNGFSLEWRTALPEIGRRLWWEACYFPVTRDWTLQHEQIHPGPHSKCHQIMPSVMLVQNPWWWNRR